MPASRYGRRSIEEAGSGTIIQHNDKFYVLTNRHVIKGRRPESIKIQLPMAAKLIPRGFGWMRHRYCRAGSIAPSLVPCPNRQQRRHRNWRLRPRRRQPVWVKPLGHLRHRQRQGPPRSRSGRRRQVPGLHADRCRHQSRQQRRAAGEPARRSHRHQHRHRQHSGGNEGIGFTIPIDMVMIVAKQLIERGSVTRAYLGVKLDRKFDRPRSRSEWA